MLERLAREADARRASAATSHATASTTGAACRRGTVCRSRSRRICRSMPAAPSARSRPSAAQDPIDTRLRLPDRGQGRDPRAGHLDLRKTTSATIVRSPLALVGSDGNCVATYGTVSQGMPHPRFYGTFPRIIGHYVRRARPAAARARDPQDDRRDRARAQAQGSRPAQGRLLRRRRDLRSRPTSGIAPPTPTRTSIRPAARTTVIVNGTVVVENATHTGALPGKVLRRDGDGHVG